MQFNPQTETEIEEEDRKRKEEMLLPAGQYPCEIGEAEIHTSRKSGKESIKIGMKVFKPDGNHILVWDYLTPNFKKKWKHAAECFGLQADYAAGKIEPYMFENKTGVVILEVDMNEGTKYDPQNRVEDYVVPAGQRIEDYSSAKAAPAETKAPVEDDDEIPF